MTYGGRPGKNGPWGRPGDNGGAVPPQWGYGKQDDTPVLGQSGQRARDEREQRAGGGGLWQPPEWRYRQQQGQGQRGYAPGQPQTRSQPTWPAQPGQQGFGPPSQQPPYRPPQPPYQPGFQPAFQPPQPGKSWPARHKALTGLLAFLALIIIIAAARTGGPSSPPGKGTTAGLTTTTSPTATQSPSHHATRAAATARKTQSQTNTAGDPGHVTRAGAVRTRGADDTCGGDRPATICRPIRPQLPGRRLPGRRVPRRQLAAIRSPTRGTATSLVSSAARLTTVPLAWQATVSRSPARTTTAGAGNPPEAPAEGRRAAARAAWRRVRCSCLRGPPSPAGAWCLQPRLPARVGPVPQRSRNPQERCATPSSTVF